MSVTLAGEISAVVVNMLITALHDGQLHMDIEDLREIYGMRPYRLLKRHIKHMEQDRTKLHTEINNLERTINLFELGSTLSPLSSDGGKTRSALCGLIYWNAETPRPELMHRVRGQYEQLAKDYKRISAQVEEGRKQFQELWNQIDANPEFIRRKKMLFMTVKDNKFGEQKGEYKERMICADFSMGAPLLDEGVCHILRNTAQNWWSRFTALVEKEVNDDALEAMPQVMLRDLFLNNAIDERRLGKKGCNLDLATCEILKYPHRHNSYLHWSSSGISADGARDWRRTLRDEDHFAITWISERTGKRHPADPYRS